MGLSGTDTSLSLIPRVTPFVPILEWPGWRNSLGLEAIELSVDTGIWGSLELTVRDWDALENGLSTKLGLGPEEWGLVVLSELDNVSFTGTGGIERSTFLVDLLVRNCHVGFICSHATRRLPPAGLHSNAPVQPLHRRD
jgi:hypothetical protein